MGKESFSFQKLKLILQGFWFSFRHFFSPFQNIIGVDLGQGYLKLIQVQKSGGGYVLLDYKVRAIPHKVQNDVVEKEKFVKDFIQEYIFQSRIRRGLGRIAVKGDGVFIFSFSMPPLSDKDLRGAVGIELKKRLPHQLDMSSISYKYFVSARYEAESPSLMVTCIAVDNKVLDAQLEILKASHLRPVTINTPQDALGSLLKTIDAPQDVAVLEMGTSRSYLNFYRDSTLRFSREVPVGGEHFTQGMHKALAHLKSDVSVEDAETFKRQCGIPMEEDGDTDFYTDFGPLKGSHISTVLRPVLERLVTEVSRTISFYFRTYKVRKVDKLFLTGGSSRIKNIERFFIANLSKATVRNVEKLNPLKALKRWQSAGISRQEMLMGEAAPHLSVALSLCIDKGGKVNLLPMKEKIEQKAMFFMFLTRSISPLIFILLVGFYMVSYGKGKFYEKLTQDAQRQIKELKPKVEKVDEYIAFRNRLLEGESLLKQAVGKHPLWWGILKELTNITPPEVTLHSLEIKAGQTPKKVILVGEVMSQYTDLDMALSQYILNLEESPYFAKPTHQRKRDEYSHIPRAIFEIVCEVKI